MNWRSMLFKRLERILETERLFPFLAMVIASIRLLQGECDFVDWSVFVGVNVIGGTTGALVKKRFVDKNGQD